MSSDYGVALNIHRANKETTDTTGPSLSRAQCQVMKLEQNIAARGRLSWYFFCIALLSATIYSLLLLFIDTVLAGTFMGCFFFGSGHV